MASLSNKLIINEFSEAIVRADFFKMDYERKYVKITTITTNTNGDGFKNTIVWLLCWHIGHLQAI